MNGTNTTQSPIFGCTHYYGEGFFKGREISTKFDVEILSKSLPSG